MKWAYLIGILPLLCSVAVGAKAKTPCPLVLESVHELEGTPILAVDTKGKFAVVSSPTKTEPLLLPLDGQIAPKLAATSEPVVALAISSPVRGTGLVAVGDASGNTEISSLSGEPLYRIDPLVQAPTQLTFSRSGNWLLNVEPGLVTLHHADTGDMPRALKLRGIEGAAFSKTTPQIATKSEDGSIRMWWMGDLETSPRFNYPLVPRALRPIGPPVTTMEFAPRHHLFAAGSTEGGINLWDPVNRKLIAPMHTVKSPVTALSFSLDGNRLLSTTESGVGQVWNTNSGRSPIVIPAEKYGTISAAYLIRDGQYALVAHGDGKVRIWELRAPKPNGRRNAEVYYEYSGHTGPIVDLKMLPDSSFLTVGADGKVMRGQIPHIPAKHDPRDNRESVPTIPRQLREPSSAN